MSSFKLLISNLPEGDADGLKEELQDLFKTFGNVISCTFYRNNYAMVDMDNEENSTSALKELNGKLFREKELSVENMKNITEQTQNIPVIRLSVTNVAPNVKSDEVKDLFTKYGLVTACEITEGSGYVNVEATGDIRTAIKEMNGFVLDDLALKVEPDVTSTSTPNTSKVKSPAKVANTKSPATKGTVIKKTYTNKPNRGRPPFGGRIRGRGRVPMVRQFYEDEDLSALSNLGNSYDYDYDESYYGEMETDGEYYPSESMMGGPFIPPRPGMSFRPSMQDPSFFPRRGSRGGPGRIMRAPGPGPQRLLGPRLPMHMGPEQGPGAFQGFRGRGMAPGRGSGGANPFGRGAMRGSLIGRGMMRGRGVFRGAPNGRGFPPYYSQEEEFYEDEMPEEYLNPGMEVPVRIPRYAIYEGRGNRNYSQPRGNGPPPYFGGYEEEPMEEEYYGEEVYENYYEDEPIVPPPYLGSGGGYRESMSQDYSNGGPSQSFPRQASKRGQFNAQMQQRQNPNVDRAPKKRPVAPGEPYPPPPLRAGSSFVPPKKKFKGKVLPTGGQQKKGNPPGPGPMGNKKKNNANKKNVNGNTAPIGGGARGGRPQTMLQTRPAMAMNQQQMYRPPAPRAPGAGGMPRFGMRPQMQQQPRKAQNANLNAPGNRPRMATPKNNARPMIDFTADIDIN